MSLFSKRKDAGLQEEREKAKAVFAEVQLDANNLAHSIDEVTDRIGMVTGETTNMSSVMEEFTASLEEMSSNITEISDNMEEMDESLEKYNLPKRI